MRISFLALFFFGCVASVFAQSSFAPLNEDYYHMIDRYEVKSGVINPFFFSGSKPYKRSDIVAFTDTIQQMQLFQSKADLFNYEYLQNDNWEWSRAESSNSVRKPFLKTFYKKKSDFFSVDKDGLDLHVNPVIYLSGGSDNQRDQKLWTNTRGVEVRGMVDKKIGFYAYFTDNQAVLPSYVWDPMTANPIIPHEGFWKGYNKGNGVDFFQARGYITFDISKHINVQMGHDRFFIGNGYRSLIWSDYSPPAWFVKGNVKVWKLNYMFVINQMTAKIDGDRTGLRSSNGGYPNKFTAYHELSVNLGKKFNLGLFETVIFSNDDSLGTKHFRLDYVNPLIFYRAIEQQNGSTDNVLLGMNFKWNAVRSLSFYGQFVLDEFVLDHIKKRDGWWANKYAIQAGAKYIDAFGVHNLDLQGEVNVVRPYTYSHGTNYANYSSYQQSLAHPLGANFKEVVGILRYQPLGRLNVVGKLSYVKIGRDTANVNFGSNILKNNNTRYQEYDNKIGQGISNTILFGTLTVSWQLKHNLFVDANLILRKSDLPYFNQSTNTTVSSLGLRWNIARRLYEF